MAIFENQHFLHSTASAQVLLVAGALVTAGAFGVTGDSCWCCCCHWCNHQEHQNGRCFCHVQGHLSHGYHCCGGDTEVYVVSWDHRCLHCLQGCWVCGHCSHWWEWGTAVVGTATVRGTGLWALLPLLPGSLWLWVPLQLGSQRCMHYLSCCHQVLWGVDFSCHGQRAEIAGTTFTVSLVLPPLYVPIHQPSDL